MEPLHGARGQIANDVGIGLEQFLIWRPGHSVVRSVRGRAAILADSVRLAIGALSSIAVRLTPGRIIGAPIGSLRPARLRALLESLRSGRFGRSRFLLRRGRRPRKRRGQRKHEREDEPAGAHRLVDASGIVRRLLVLLIGVGRRRRRHFREHIRFGQQIIILEHTQMLDHLKLFIRSE